MLSVSDSKLYTIRQQVIRQLPLPEEMTVQLDVDKLRELLQTIESVPDGADFDLLVARLPRRQLNDLFGLLLVIEPAAGGAALPAADSARPAGLTLPVGDPSLVGSLAARGPESVQQVKERIHRVLERRATASLVQTGWAFYQQHFFHADLGEAMERLCKVLAAKGETEAFVTGCRTHGFGEELPSKLADQWIEEQALPIHALNKSWSLGQRLSEYAVILESRFATVLLQLFFQRLPVDRVPAEAALFARCLEQSGTEEQGRLITLIYDQQHLEPAFDPISQAVMNLCGVPRKGNPHPVWEQVPKQATHNFRHWCLIDALNRHLSGQPRKLMFYQPFLLRLADCTLLAPDVLLVEFPKFFLVDHRDFSHQIFYYDRPTLELAREAQTSADDLAMPARYSTAREVILTQNRANCVLLKLEEVNLLYARDFIDDLLNPPQKNKVI